MVSYYPAGSVDYDPSYPKRNMKIISDILKGADSIDADTTEWIISDNKLMKYLGSKTSVVVPKGITAIGYCAFTNGLTNIEDMACKHCPSLASLTLPASIEKISDFAFNSNDDLIIYAPISSYAEQYAKEHDLKFEGT